MLSKKTSIIFLSTIVMANVLFFTALYIYDPMSVFHMPYSRELALNNNMRQQNISLIRHLNFDSIIIGNSFTENTSVKEAEEQLGGRFINISMSGSNLYECSLVLEYVLSRRKIKTVFGVLAESTSRKGHGSYPLSEWSFLYDDNYLNDFKVYFNRHYLNCLARWSSSTGCIGRQVDMDRPSAWLEYPEHASRFGGLDNWILHHENGQLRDLLHKTLPQNANESPICGSDDIDPKIARDISAAIDEFIVKPAKEYPETNFIYFFNPYSLLQRAIAARGNGLKNHAFWVKEATLSCASLNNVQLYFFDNEPFTKDIKYYKDLGHYSPDINSLILQSIRLNRNRLTPDNVDEHLRLLAERAVIYNIKAINDYVQEGIWQMSVDAEHKNYHNPPR